jgi:hypothetical protein
MACLAEYDKHPSDTLELTINWAEWLAGDVLNGSTWYCIGLTAVDGGYTATTSSVTISGGAVGGIYETRNTITTSAGRTEVRRLRISVKSCTAGTPSQVGWSRSSQS